MFSGIVTAVGRIAAAKLHGDGVRLRIETPGFDTDDVAIGDSIAVQGVCLTAVAKDSGDSRSTSHGPRSR
jgi:riboflavin synthase